MQEKVVEFSKMTPEELLINTERAIDDASLFEMHNQLIHGGKDLKQKQIDMCEPRPQQWFSHRQRNPDYSRLFSGSR